MAERQQGEPHQQEARGGQERGGRGRGFGVFSGGFVEDLLKDKSEALQNDLLRYANDFKARIDSAKTAGKNWGEEARTFIGEKRKQIEDALDEKRAQVELTATYKVRGARATFEFLTALLMEDAERGGGSSERGRGRRASGTERPYQSFVEQIGREEAESSDFGRRPESTVYLGMLPNLRKKILDSKEDFASLVAPDVVTAEGDADDILDQITAMMFQQMNNPDEIIYVVLKSLNRGMRKNTPDMDNFIRNMLYYGVGRLTALEDKYEGVEGYEGLSKQTEDLERLVTNCANFKKFVHEVWAGKIQASDPKELSAIGEAAAKLLGNGVIMDFLEDPVIFEAFHSLKGLVQIDNSRDFTSGNVTGDKPEGYDYTQPVTGEKSQVVVKGKYFGGAEFIGHMLRWVTLTGAYDDERMCSRNAYGIYMQTYYESYADSKGWMDNDKEIYYEITESGEIILHPLFAYPDIWNSPNTMTDIWYGKMKNRNKLKGILSQSESISTYSKARNLAESEWTDEQYRVSETGEMPEGWEEEGYLFARADNDFRVAAGQFTYSYQEYKNASTENKKSLYLQARRVWDYYDNKGEDAERKMDLVRQNRKGIPLQVRDIVTPEAKELALKTWSSEQISRLRRGGFPSSWKDEALLLVRAEDDFRVADGKYSYTRDELLRASEGQRKMMYIEALEEWNRYGGGVENAEKKMMVAQSNQLEEYKGNLLDWKTEARLMLRYAKGDVRTVLGLQTYTKEQFENADPKEQMKMFLDMRAVWDSLGDSSKYKDGEIMQRMIVQNNQVNDRWIKHRKSVLAFQPKSTDTLEQAEVFGFIKRKLGRHKVTGGEEELVSYGDLPSSFNSDANTGLDELSMSRLLSRIPDDPRGEQYRGAEDLQRETGVEWKNKFNEAKARFKTLPLAQQMRIILENTKRLPGKCRVIAKNDESLVFKFKDHNNQESSLNVDNINDLFDKTSGIQDPFLRTFLLIGFVRESNLKIAEDLEAVNAKDALDNQAGTARRANRKKLISELRQEANQLGGDLRLFGEEVGRMEGMIDATQRRQKGTEIIQQFIGPDKSRFGKYLAPTVVIKSKVEGIPDKKISAAEARWMRDTSHQDQARYLESQLKDKKVQDRVEHGVTDKTVSGRVADYEVSFRYGAVVPTSLLIERFDALTNNWEIVKGYDVKKGEFVPITISIQEFFDRGTGFGFNNDELAFLLGKYGDGDTRDWSFDVEGYRNFKRRILSEELGRLKDLPIGDVEKIININIEIWKNVLPRDVVVRRVKKAWGDTLLLDVSTFDPNTKRSDIARLQPVTVDGTFGNKRMVDVSFYDRQSGKYRAQKIDVRNFLNEGETQVSFIERARFLAKYGKDDKREHAFLWEDFENAPLENQEALFSSALNEYVDLQLEQQREILERNSKNVDKEVRVVENDQARVGLYNASSGTWTYYKSSIQDFFSFPESELISKMTRLQIAQLLSIYGNADVRIAARAIDLSTFDTLDEDAQMSMINAVRDEFQRLDVNEKRRVLRENAKKLASIPGTNDISIEMGRNIEVRSFDSVNKKNIVRTADFDDVFDKRRELNLTLREFATFISKYGPDDARGWAFSMEVFDKATGQEREELMQEMREKWGGLSYSEREKIININQRNNFRTRTSLTLESGKHYLDLAGIMKERALYNDVSNTYIYRAYAGNSRVTRDDLAMTGPAAMGNAFETLRKRVGNAKENLRNLYGQVVNGEVIVMRGMQTKFQEESRWPRVVLSRPIEYSVYLERLAGKRDAVLFQALDYLREGLMETEQSYEKLRAIGLEGMSHTDLNEPLNQDRLTMEKRVALILYDFCDLETWASFMRREVLPGPMSTNLSDVELFKVLVAFAGLKIRSNARTDQHKYDGYMVVREAKDCPKKNPFTDNYEIEKDALGREMGVKRYKDSGRAVRYFDFELDRDGSWSNEVLDPIMRKIGGDWIEVRQLINSRVGASGMGFSRLMGWDDELKIKYKLVDAAVWDNYIEKDKHKTYLLKKQVEEELNLVERATLDTKGDYTKEIPSTVKDVAVSLFKSIADPAERQRARDEFEGKYRTVYKKDEDGRVYKEEPNQVYREEGLLAKKYAGHLHEQIVDAKLRDRRENFGERKMYITAQLGTVKEARDVFGRLDFDQEVVVEDIKGRKVTIGPSQMAKIVWDDITSSNKLIDINGEEVEVTSSALATIYKDRNRLGQPNRLKVKIFDVDGEEIDVFADNTYLAPNSFVSEELKGSPDLYDYALLPRYPYWHWYGYGRTKLDRIDAFFHGTFDTFPKHDLGLSPMYPFWDDERNAFRRIMVFVDPRYTRVGGFIGKKDFRRDKLYLLIANPIATKELIESLSIVQGGDLPFKTKLEQLTGVFEKGGPGAKESTIVRRYREALSDINFPDKETGKVTSYTQEEEAQGLKTAQGVVSAAKVPFLGTALKTFFGGTRTESIIKRINFVAWGTAAVGYTAFTSGIALNNLFNLAARANILTTGSLLGNVLIGAGIAAVINWFINDPGLDTNYDEISNGERGPIDKFKNFINKNGGIKRRRFENTDPDRIVHGPKATWPSMINGDKIAQNDQKIKDNYKITVPGIK